MLKKFNKLAYMFFSKFAYLGYSKLYNDFYILSLSSNYYYFNTINLRTILIKSFALINNFNSVFDLKITRFIASSI